MLDWTPSISSLPTMLWQHNAWLDSFCFFTSYNAVTQQCFIGLLLFRPILQCCDSTMLYWTPISSHPIMLWQHNAWLDSFCFFPSYNAVTPQSFVGLFLFLPVLQCCDTTMLNWTPISSHPTILWCHKAWLNSFYLFPSYNAVTPQCFIGLLFLPFP